MLSTLRGIAYHLCTVSQADLGTGFRSALHHGAIAARTSLIADLASTIHVRAFPPRAVLHAAFLGRAFDVLAQTSEAILIAFFGILARAQQWLSAVYAILTRRLALTVMSVVALGVEVRTATITDFVECTRARRRAFVDAFVRATVKDTMAFLASLPADLDVSTAGEDATGTRAFLFAFLGAAS